MLLQRIVSVGAETGLAHELPQEAPAKEVQKHVEGFWEDAEECAYFAAEVQPYNQADLVARFTAQHAHKPDSYMHKFGTWGHTTRVTCSTETWLSWPLPAP